MQLKIQKARSELKNVNLRTENNGDERVLACDLKIVADTTALSLSALFEDSPAFLDSVYDEAGNVLNPCVSFVYRVPIENVDVTIDKLKPMKGGKVKKNITLLPRDGRRMEATFTVQFSDVSVIDPFAKRLHNEVNITIVERQQSLQLATNDGEAVADG